MDRQFYTNKKHLKHKRDFNKMYYYVIRELIDRFKISFTELRINWRVDDNEYKDIKSLDFSYIFGNRQITIIIEKDVINIDNFFFITIYVSGTPILIEQLDDNESVVKYIRQAMAK